MLDQEKDESEYADGFNKGYFVAKHTPELAQKLKDVSGNSVQLTGFKEGVEQFNKEQTKEKLPDWMRRDRLDSNTKDFDKDKNKNELDRE